jgi:hypothetical protein
VTRMSRFTTGRLRHAPDYFAEFVEQFRLRF